jgi:hypothetical protein
MKLLLRFSLTFLLFAQLAPLAAYADTGGALSIATSPLPINLVTGPGTTTTTTLRVKNDGTSPERLKVSLLKFRASGTTGQPFLQERQSGDSYFDWVSFSPSVFDAPPGEWQTITMTIKVPKSAAFDYYLAAVFSRSTSITPTGGTTAVAGSTATLVLLTVSSPDAKRQLEAVHFTADSSFYEFLPTTFNVQLHNSGNIHVVPTGNIFITRGNSQVGSIQINQAAGSILPNSDRIYTTAWTDGFPVYVPKLQDGKPIVSNGKPAMSLKWDITQIQKLRFGHYTAHMTVIYNDGIRDVPITGVVSFWVIPWRLIAAFVLILLPSVYWFIRYRRVRKALRRYQQKGKMA